jgi:hypothetical protein
MAFEILDPNDLLTDNLFFEDKFIEKVEKYDWDKFQNKKVLVRGCDSALIPPWAYMIITSRLINLAQSIRFGNEHDNIVVYRNKQK